MVKPTIASKEKDQANPLPIQHLNLERAPTGQDCRIELRLGDLDVERLLGGEKIILGNLSFLSTPIKLMVSIHRLRKKDAKTQELPVIQSC